MRLFKGDVCAIALPNNDGYIYFLYYGGNTNMGYIIKVFDYQSKELEDKVEKIVNQKPLFKNKYINSYAPYHSELLTKVGKVKIDKEELEKIEFYDRLSIQASRFYISKQFKQCLKLSEDYTDEEYIFALYEYAKSGKKHIFDDWKINKSGFIGNKYDFIKEYHVGKLTPEQSQYMIFSSSYLSEDIIEYFKTGIDRLWAEALIFR